MQTNTENNGSEWYNPFKYSCAKLTNWYHWLKLAAINKTYFNHILKSIIHLSDEEIVWNLIFEKS